MTRFLNGIFAILAIFSMPHFADAKEVSCPAAVHDVYYSPRGGATLAVVEEIGKASHLVRVLAYSFTSKPIAIALIAAHKRGVDVEIVVDKSQRTSKGTQAPVTAKAGIPTYVDSAHRIAHNKVMVIDGETIITGSFNFTQSAEINNGENLLILRGCPDMVAAYMEDYRRHKEHALKFRRDHGSRQG